MINISFDRFALLLLFFLSGLTLSAQDKPSSKVRFIYTYMEDIQEGKDNYLWKKEEYGYDGKLLYEISYNMDGSLYNAFCYKYDSAGNNILFEVFDWDSLLRYGERYGYDSKGHKIEKIQYDTLRDIFQVKYEYNEEGKLVKESTTYNPGTDSTIKGDDVIYVRNNGKRVEKADGNVRTVYLYNSNNKCISEKRYVKNEMDEEYLYSYNAAGKLTCEEHYIDNDLTWETSHNYDSAGRWIKKTTLRGGESVHSIYIFSYDENGRRSAAYKYSEYYKDASVPARILRYKYEYFIN